MTSPMCSGRRTAWRRGSMLVLESRMLSAKLHDRAHINKHECIHQRARAHTHTTHTHTTKPNRKSSISEKKKTMNRNRFNSPCSLQKSKQLLYFGAQHVQQWDHHGWLHVLGQVANLIPYIGISHFHWSGLGRENSIFVFHVQAAHGICFHGITRCSDWAVG